jgi:hypothetical protein
MPNIGISFEGASSSSSCITDQQQPSTSAIPSSHLLDSSDRAGTSKDTEPPPRLDLYEELLASTAGKIFVDSPIRISLAYGDWNETDDATLLEQIIALSQQEFIDGLKKSPARQ